MLRQKVLMRWSPRQIARWSLSCRRFSTTLDVPVTTYYCGKKIPPAKPAENFKSRFYKKRKALEAQRLDCDVIDRLTPTMKRFALPEKVVVVTGGARGLGLSIAQAMTETGVRGIAIMDLNEETGDKAAQELSQQSGIDVRFYKLDVTDDMAVNQAVSDVAEHFGRIDVLVNSAGIADTNMPAENYNSAMFRRLLDINITGNFLVAQAVAKHMIESQIAGSLIFIASMSGKIVNFPQEQSCYNASKAAIAHLSSSLAAEWAKYGIRCNTISPGYMDTPLNQQPGLELQKEIWRDRTPMKRLGSPDELDALAIFLASEGSSFMTGANCVIDGGYVLW